MQGRGGGGQDLARGVEAEGVALPVGDDTARALDHRHQRHVVVGLQAALHHQVDAAERDQGVAVAVEAVAAVLHRPGQPLERLQFTQFSTAAPDDSGLQPSEACQAVPAGKPDAPVASSWRSEWVPPGFTLNNTYERRSPVSDDRVVSMDYGDGLARFSIFIEPLHGARIDDARTQLGPTSVVSKRLNTEDGGMMVTVVGEIPTGTAERIAMSVRPQASAQGAAAQ